MYVDICEGESPVLLEMPHSGLLGYGAGAAHALPPWLSSRIRFESEEVRKMAGFGCDAAVPLMSGYDTLLKELPVTGIRNRLARVFVDPNRDRDEVSGFALQGAEPLQHIHGVVWARTVPYGIDPALFSDPVALGVAAGQASQPLLDAPLTPQLFEKLMQLGYDPYREAIEAQHRRIRDEFGQCIHLALHSLPPFQVTTVAGGYVCGPPATRGRFGESPGAMPDVILIHNNYAAASERVVQRLRGAFAGSGLIVQNGFGPFVGNRGVTKAYGDPRNKIHVIGIEHVTHGGLEPGRHLGDATVDEEKARAFQRVYRTAVEAMLDC